MQPLTKNTPSMTARVRGRSKGGEGQADDGQKEDERAAQSKGCDV